VAIPRSESRSARAGRDGLLAQVQAALAHRYRIERSIGRGAMAVVYRASHLASGNPVAIKVMRPELGYEDGVVERFRIEALAMGQLHHENIVEVRASGEAATFSGSRWSSSTATPWTGRSGTARSSGGGPRDSWPRPRVLSHTLTRLA
jgi:serine/threonine protein kinase